MEARTLKRMIGGGPLASVIFAICVVAQPAYAEDATPFSLSEAQWLAADADIVGALSRSPGECLREPASEEQRYLVEAGRAAFRSPLLLGGPAARNGLSCNSCHRDGHDNPDFFLAGLSGEPGTADVTSSIFSKSREDDAFNPVEIPTLVGAGAKASFGTMAPQPSLHAFIGGAIHEEFQGEPPPPAILEGLAAYVASLDEEACPEGVQRQTVRLAMDDVERALAAARGAVERNDADAADFLILAAQRSLLVVHERFASVGLSGESATIEELARGIAALRTLASSAPQEALAALDAVARDAAVLEDRLHKRRKKSLYDLQVLKRALERSRTENQ